MKIKLIVYRGMLLKMLSYDLDATLVNPSPVTTTKRKVWVGRVIT